MGISWKKLAVVCRLNYCIGITTAHVTADVGTWGKLNTFLTNELALKKKIFLTTETIIYFKTTP